MDITSFVVTSRESALLDGDFATYRTQLSRKLLNARKKLNLATKHRAKFQRKPDITPEQVAGNHGCVFPRSSCQEKLSLCVF